MSVRRIIYSLFLYLIFPLVILRLFWRSRSNPAYRKRILERLGVVSIKNEKPIIWVHAVSVGETNAATPLIESLISNYPDHQVLVTTTTPTGSERVKTLFSDRVEHVYFPYDLPEIIWRFMRRVKPQILIVVETEIWPNLFASCHKRDVPIIIVNARLSEGSTKAYLKVKGLIKETLTNISLIAVRSEADAISFKKLGANDQQVTVTGNIKFDFSVDKKQAEKGLLWKQQWGVQRPVLVAASTHDGEDEILLKIYQNLLKCHPELLLVLIPRHPERFDRVYQLCSDIPLLNALRHSQTASYEGHDAIHIILGDSMGEMQSWFATADVVFIGGSLVKTGGHNPLEATAQGKPVVSGQYMFNFRDVVPELTQHELLFVCDNELKLENKTSNLLQKNLSEFAIKGKAIMQKNRGVTARLLALINELRPQHNSGGK